MKRLSILFVVLMSAMLIGCKSEKKKDTGENPNLIQPEFIVSKDDTVQVRRLANQLFHYMEQKDINGALSLLNIYDKGEIQPLPPAVYAKERMVLGMFLGMKYEVDHLIFFRPDDSELKYTVTMFEHTDSADRRPNKASFLIRPVRKNGTWFLTLADTQTERKKSQIKL